MRKMAVIPMAALLALAIAAPVAAGGPNVTNQSGSATVVNGEWYSDSGWGYAYFGTDSEYGAAGEVYEETGQYEPCDESGETYGFVGSRTYGWTNDLSIDLDAKLSHASASGTFELATETVNECTGEYAGGDPSSVAFSASLDGVGAVARFRGMGSYHVPGDFNSHSKQSGRERSATGSLDLGDAGVREFDSAVLASITWSDHTNN
jgi:hypothetical protein